MNDQKQPLVSIVLPVYNGARYLEESLQSIIDQTHENWELLIVDDCSSDKSPELAKKWAEKDKRIQYHRNPENLKLPATLNRGFSLAKGDFLTWTSDDNRYLPKAIERMVATLQEKEAAFIYCDHWSINDDGERVEEVAVKEPPELIHANYVNACFMYPRNTYEKMGDYDTALFLCEDYDYWLRIMSSGLKLVTLHETLYEYRYHAGSLTTKKAKAVCRAGRILRERSLGGIDVPASDKADSFSRCAGLCLRNGLGGEVLHCVRGMLKHQPAAIFQKQTWVYTLLGLKLCMSKGGASE